HLSPVATLDVARPPPLRLIAESERAGGAAKGHARWPGSIKHRVGRTGTAALGSLRSGGRRGQRRAVSPAAQQSAAAPSDLPGGGSRRGAPGRRARRAAWANPLEPGRGPSPGDLRRDLERAGAYATARPLAGRFGR